MLNFDELRPVIRSGVRDALAQAGTIVPPVMVADEALAAVLEYAMGVAGPDVVRHALETHLMRMSNFELVANDDGPQAA